MRSLRYELAVTQVVDRYPPAVRRHFEAGGWLVVGTEHLDGPHADLSPGSPDLGLLAATLKDLQETPAPGRPLFTPWMADLAKWTGRWMTHRSDGHGAVIR